MIMTPHPTPKARSLPYPHRAPLVVDPVDLPDEKQALPDEASGSDR